MPVSYCYPVEVEPNGEGGYIASFPDVPEALTEADTIDELLDMALDALITAVEFYVEDQREFPAASDVVPGQHCIQLPLSVVGKVLLLNAMVESNIRPADLAKRMGTTRQEVNRITNIRHATKVDTLQRAFYSIGKRLTLSVA